VVEGNEGLDVFVVVGDIADVDVGFSVVEKESVDVDVGVSVVVGDIADVDVGFSVVEEESVDVDVGVSFSFNSDRHVSMKNSSPPRHVCKSSNFCPIVGFIPNSIQ